MPIATLKGLSEKEFEKQAAALLQWNKFIVIRINTIKHKVLRSYRIYGSEEPNAGFPDLIALYPPDKVLLIETKSKGGKLRPTQQGFMEFLAKHRFTSIKKASNLEELQAIIKEFKNDTK